MEKKAMKWIFWIIWGVFCIIGMLFNMLAYILGNMICLLWRFSIKDLFKWKDYSGYSYLYWDEEDNVFTKYTEDKNPWETYKRWTFL